MTSPSEGRRSLLLGTVAVLLSVALFTASFPPFGLRPLAWVALAPLFATVRQASPRRAFGAMLLWSFAAAYATGTWLPPAIANYFEQPLAVGIFVFVFVAATMVAPYYLVFAWCYRRMPEHAALPLLAAAGWVMAELGRGRLLTGTPFFIGNPWGLVGYSQAGLAEVTQVASLFGVYGVSFVVAASNAAVADLLRLRGTLGARPVLARLALGLFPGALAIGFGAATLERGDEPGEPTRLAIVQGNLDLGSRWQREFYGRNLDVYLDLTRAAIEHSAPAMVFWPEAAMTFFVDREPGYRRAIGQTLATGDAELIAGAVRAEGEGRSFRYFNTTYAFSPDGEIQSRYDKQYLVPFTEYFPFRIDLIRRQFGRAREFSAGAPGPPLETRAGPAGTVVCNEVMLPEVVSQRVVDGASYLVNPSNDSWLADVQYSEMQFDIVRFRSIEQRRYLVRASTSGPSAVIDPWGRVRVRSEPEQRSVIIGEVRPRTDRTVYSRIGDGFAFGCVGLVLLMVVRSRRREARELA